ncbi:MAG TPA: alpha/beta hydrolase [Gammaproteobacteria bacterium]|nr:alpha/beta hydrolase [Gammaproteobacteria bacterium]
MPLTAESMAVLDILQQKGVHPLDHFAPAEGRPYFNAVFATPPEDREAVAILRELRIPVAGDTIAARLYAPKAGPLPTLVHFHGGGWVYMGLETHDGYCRHLANAAQIAVIAVEYRKAPEFKAPTAAEDCNAALKWVLANAGDLGVDAARVGLIGDSAGGNLAAVVAQLARDAGIALKCQVLTYPAVDATLASASIKENATAPILGEKEMRWFYDHYLNGAKVDAKDPLVSPLYARSLAKLPPAFISTAEFDPLRDEGEAYAKQLEAAGVPVECKRYAGVFHGFLLMSKLIPEGRQLIQDQLAFLKRHL